MSAGEGITRELSWSETISKTFELYQRGFAKYFVLFLIVEAIIGAVSTLASQAFTLPTLPSNPTPQQVIDWAPGFFGTLSLLLVTIGLVSLVFSPLADGSTVKMASDEIQNRSPELGPSFRFALTKLVWMWILGIIIVIAIGLGLIALIIPGVILAIMFCLAFPALLIENAGVLGSLGRSRELVSHRWLKTFVIFLVLAIILLIASAVVSFVSAPFGVASNFVSSVLSAFYLPLLPIALTVYYYSNLARISPTQASSGATATQMQPQPGMKFCPNCGTQLLSAATFCSNCGAKQPAV